MSGQVVSTVIHFVITIDLQRKYFYFTESDLNEFDFVISETVRGYNINYLSLFSYACCTNEKLSNWVYFICFKGLRESTITAMSLFSWIYTMWHCSAPSLLLVGLVGRQLGLRVGLQVVQTVTCSRLGASIDQGLFQDGDIIIGGLFSLYHKPPAIDHNFTQEPDYKSCKG